MIRLNKEGQLDRQKKERTNKQIAKQMDFHYVSKLIDISKQIKSIKNYSSQLKHLP